MKIQLALDRLTIQEAINIAKKAEAFIDWIEVGTSLIKEFGMESIYEIKNAFPHKSVVADIKTIDNAKYEFEICYQAGADIATVMGVSPQATLHTCYDVTQKWDKMMMIDLLNTAQETQQKLAIYNKAVFCHHLSKDEQEIEGKSTPSYTNLRAPFFEGSKVAVAGGVNLETMSSLSLLTPDVIIIGSSITKAKDIEKAAAAFKNKIEDEGVVK
ncbi:orotidine 5'-phosphate decarboxylase [Priestia filamentosa]|uniref:3-hexulose-6-phosphate synthase n=1 Tax=Priestia filamentosa TaxID=1402861 RepID=UPI001FB561B6|nr:3-hexulose-6-phosphate synthase [Priestia filamentosa]UOE62833.1 orotidine 5'-phosphate decarboxylase [Priestia filamentosa]